MRAYAKEYVSDVVENQGKLFDLVAQKYPDKDTAAFINSYMASKTRKSIDEAKAYVNTMSAPELWEYFCKTDGFTLKDGKASRGLCRTGSANFMRIINGIIICPAAKL
mgnify:FL=1